MWNGHIQKLWDVYYPLVGRDEGYIIYWVLEPDSAFGQEDPKSEDAMEDYMEMNFEDIVEEEWHEVVQITEY